MSDDNELSAEESAYFKSGGQEAPAEVEKEVEEVAEVEADDEIDTEAELAPDEPEGKAEPEKKVRTVPHQALHAERSRRQAIEAQLQQERETRSRLDERVRMLSEAWNQRNQPEAPAIPDPEQDPIAALKYEREQRERYEQQRQREVQERQQYEQVNQLDTTYRRDWEAFQQDKPDAPAAYNHVISVLDNHFKLRGVDDPAERQQMVMNEERTIAQRAYQQGKSAAQMIYEQAKVYGYMPKADEPAVAPEQKASEQIERRQKAIPAARSMSAAGGSANDAALSPESLANMSEDEFMEVYSKLSPRKQAALLGG